MTVIGLCHFVHPPKQVCAALWTTIHRQTSCPKHDLESWIVKAIVAYPRKDIGKMSNNNKNCPMMDKILGLPKMGTMSITRYFQCSGIEQVSHWHCKDMEYCGPMIQDNVHMGRAPLHWTANLMPMVTWISRFMITTISHKLKLLRRFRKPIPIPHISIHSQCMQCDQLGKECPWMVWHGWSSCQMQHYWFPYWCRQDGLGTDSVFHFSAPASEKLCSQTSITSTYLWRLRLILLMQAKWWRKHLELIAQMLGTSQCRQGYYTRLGHQ